MPDLTVPDPAPTWDAIASSVGVPLGSLLVANGKDPNTDWMPPAPGDVVHVPECTNVAAAPDGCVTVESGSALLDRVLEGLTGQAHNFASVCINDSKARQSYVDRIARMSEEWRRAARAGEISWEAAAIEANRVRNVIMDEARAVTSSIGKAIVRAEKWEGLTLEAAIDKVVTDKFKGRSFGDLTQAERRVVFQGVVDSSGRSSQKFTSLIPVLDLGGKACVILTVSIAAYDIWSAKNHVQNGEPIGPRDRDLQWKSRLAAGTRRSPSGSSRSATT